MIIYFFLQKYYRRSYVELQRCDATSRSPVYAHFSESLTGVETIRAFRYQEKFASKSDSQIDYNHRCDARDKICLVEIAAFQSDKQQLHKHADDALIFVAFSMRQSHCQPLKESWISILLVLLSLQAQAHH